MTEWRVIPSWPLYEASDDGQVRRVGAAKCLSPYVARRDGYLRVGLWIDGRTVQGYVHRLVCEAFHGQAPAPKLDAAHANSTKTDNRAANLSWKTRAENEFDKRANGTANIGARNGQAALDEETVREIRNRVSMLPRSSGGARIKKAALGELAAEYGVTASCLRSLTARRTWRHVQ